ncbi:MAG TPA: hypothetical protein VFW94_13270 [Candidatus Acidoferrales bacterium]|nr:hypothetical protein [Candidatus Acidoferrales bacterium]
MMRRYRCSLPFAIFASVLILTASAVGRLAAQTAPSRATRNTMVPAYDMSKEVKVQGVIEKINGFGSSGPIGTHILIHTASGVVDAHLGFGSAASSKNLGISVGQNVTVVGMMETIGDSSVLMARILTTPSRVIVLRNEHGIPVRGTTHRNVQPGTWYSANLGNSESAANSTAEVHQEVQHEVQHGGL